MKEFFEKIKSNKIMSNFFSYMAITIFAIIYFIYLYGVKVINPLYTDWIYNNYGIRDDILYGYDLLQHYLGWEGFRQSSWSFPIGMFDALSYPNSVSIIFTDSIPLLAVFFKLINFILPAKFQYLGIYGLLCFVLQGIMGVRIFRHFTNNKFLQTISAAFLVVAPIIVWRMFIHTSLGSHWLLLMAIEPIVSKKKYDYKKSLIYYCILGVLASSIHIYMYFYCGIILTGFCLLRIIEKSKIIEVISYLFSYVVFGIVTVFLLGGFTSGISTKSLGLRASSMNLNSFFDSYGFSFVLPPLKHYSTEVYSGTSVQFEGYGYLGLGVIIITGIFAYCIIANRKSEFNGGNSRKLAIAYIFILSLIIALSPTISLNDRALVEIPLPDFFEKLWSNFRATGRAVWILNYLIIICCIVVLYKYIRKNILYIILSVALIIQLIDNFKLYYNTHNFYHNIEIPVFSSDVQLFEREFWDSISNNPDIKNVVMAITTDNYSDDIVTIAFDDVTAGPEGYLFQGAQYTLGDFALKNNFTFNHFRLSRQIYESSKENTIDKLNKIIENDTQGQYLDTVFIFLDYNKMRLAVTNLNMYYADGYYIGYQGELNSKYKINSDDINFQIQGESLKLSANQYKTVSCWELPKGQYILKFSGANQLFQIGFESPVEELLYDCQVIGFDEASGDITLLVNFPKDYCQACLTIINDSNMDLVIDNVEIIRYN